jgi:hypothetical protein
LTLAKAGTGGLNVDTKVAYNKIKRKKDSHPDRGAESYCLMCTVSPKICDEHCSEQQTSELWNYVTRGAPDP